MSDSQGIGYLQQLGLHREPFSSTPDSDEDDFFLLDKDRAQRLNILYHMVQNSELLLLVTGCLGSGKTSLLHRFLDMRNDNWRHCCIDANTMMNPDQLLIEIAEGFGLPQDSVHFGSAFEAIQKRLTEMKLSELMPILIIDDAHELPVASLAVLMKLSELADNNERLLRIVLFAEESINELFNAPELKEVRHRVTHTLTMPLLDEQQTGEYLQYRLSVAGYEGEFPFSRGQVRKIQRLAGGIPGQVNVHAQELLLDSAHGPTAANTNAAGTRLRSAMSILVILGIAAGVTWYLSRDVFEQLGEQPPAPIEPTVEARDLPLLPPSKQVKPQATAVEPASESSAEATATPARRSGSATEQAPSTAAPTTSTVDTSINPFALPPAGSEPATPATTTSDKPAAAVGQTSPAPVTTKPVASKPAEPVVKPAPTPKPEPKPKDWLASQDPDHFTLQLMGSRKREAVELVQRAHKLTPDSAIVRTSLKGADWYILLYGSFKTKQQARERVSSLPAALKLTEPWPRRIGDIQALK